MHDQRRRAVPAAHEGDQPVHVLVAGRDIAFDRHGDVVHAEDEMVVGDDAFGPLHQVGILEQGDQMAGAGGFDRVMQAGERADVDHAIRRMMFARYI